MPLIVRERLHIIPGISGSTSQLGAGPRLVSTWRRPPAPMTIEGVPQAD